MLVQQAQGQEAISDEDDDMPPENSSISERFRQFCFFTKRSTLLLENSRKINFLHLFIIEQHAKLLPYLLILVD